MKQRRLFSPNLEQVKLGDVTTYAVTPDDVRAYVANRSYIGGSGLFAASARSSNGAFRNGQFFLKGDFTFKTRPTSADEIWYGPHYLTNEMPRKLNGAILDQVEQTAKDPVPTASQFFYQRAVFDLKRNETLSKAFTSETENTTVYEVVKALEATLTAQGYVK